MRALLATLAALAFVAALLLARQPEVSTGPRELARNAGEAETASASATTARGTTARGEAGHRVPQDTVAPWGGGSPANVEGGGLPPSFDRTAVAAGAPRGGSTVPPARGFASAVNVQRFVPGSPEHARAVATTLAASEYRDTVAPLARLYLASFVRVPDYEGLSHYITERGVGIGMAEIADEFAGSPEFQQRYGELDHRGFVERLLRNVGADAGLAAQWIARLEAGAMTRGEVMVAFSESDAFRATTAPQVFVAMAYAEALQRAPSPAELARWVAFLERGGRHGAMLEALVRGRGNR